MTFLIKMNKQMYLTHKYIHSIMQNEDLEKANVFETLPSEEIVKEPEMVMPEINTIEEDPLPPVPEVEPVKDETITLAEQDINKELPAALEPEEAKQPEIQPIPAVETVSESASTVPLEEPKPHAEASTFVVPPKEQDKNAELQPELELPQTLLEPQITMGTPIVEPAENKVLEEPTPILTQPIIEPIIPASTIPSKPVIPQEPISEEPKLLFDGANESNLNKALGEISEEKVVSAPQEGVESLRQFGEDVPAATSVQEVKAEEKVKTLTRSKGFANNKFFMAIAIVFFLAACVFLGYEAFQYFTLK